MKNKIKQKNQRLSESEPKQVTVKKIPLRNHEFDKHNKIMALRLIKYFRKIEHE
jgi:hypothetical protein